MRIFIEFPTWLGDTVMTTPALENLTLTYPNSEIIAFGSYPSLELIKPHKNVKKSIFDESKKSKFRALKLYNRAKSLGEFDLSISFRSHFYSKLLLHFLKSKESYIFNKKIIKDRVHQVEKYNQFMNLVLKKNLPPKSLKLYFEPFKYENPTLGINPGATYGDAKRWYPEKFAQVAQTLSKNFDIIIFGSDKEIKISQDIEKMVKQKGVFNIKNLAGKTDIPELCSKIGGLNLFITNDSGSMHIAGAYKVPTVSIFGPTKHLETSQWRNPNSAIVRKELECSPCMKRSCPIKTHECMKSITEEDVLKEVEKIFNRGV